MTKFLLATAAGLALAATPAFAADEEKAPPTADAQAKPEPKICKKDRATGSLARVNKICMTRSEWRELNSKTKKAVDDYSRNNGLAGQTNSMGQ